MHHLCFQEIDVVVNKKLGIAAGIMAGALWGLVFLALELTPKFSPLQLSAGRYLAYGVVALLLVAPSWRSLVSRVSWIEWKALIWLSLTGNIVYYVFVAKAVQEGGIAMTSIVIGLLPVVVTVIGSRDKHAVPLRQLLPSLGLSAAGLLCISWQTLTSPGHGSVTGLLCAIGALISWTAYAVSNSRWLVKLHAISSHEWSLLTGLVTGLQAIVLAIPAFLFSAPAESSSDWISFTSIVVGIAILCSVIGNGFWNYASRALPLTLTGQMIVFETIFAAFYGFLWEQRWPTVGEGAAMALLIAGVVSCAAVHRPKQKAPHQTSA
jgi:drug/metabolite transporter (DMT)-like permease